MYDSTKKTYVGMFDYGDLMTYILLLLKKMEVPLEDQTMEMRDLIQRTRKSQNVPVKLASGKDKKNRIFSVRYISCCCLLSLLPEGIIITCFLFVLLSCR